MRECERWEQGWGGGRGAGNVMLSRDARVADMISRACSSICSSTSLRLLRRSFTALSSDAFPPCGTMTVAKCSVAGPMSRDFVCKRQQSEIILAEDASERN